MQRQKSIDKNCIINGEDLKHEESSIDPKSSLVLVTKPTFDDLQYYRLLV